MDLKLATAFGGGALSAEVVLHLLKEGAYRRHVQALRTRLAAARATVGPRLDALGLRAGEAPEAGLFLWRRLPEGVDGAALARAAWASGVVLAPGDAFSVSRSCAGVTRFNVAQMQSPESFETLARLLPRA